MFTCKKKNHKRVFIQISIQAGFFSREATVYIGYHNASLFIKFSELFILYLLILYFGTNN